MPNKAFLTKIFLDGADPMESQEARKILGFLDGQTTNPTLLMKNPELKQVLHEKGKLSEEELYDFYRETIKRIAQIAKGPISVEVYADQDTRAEQMLAQAREMSKWAPEACIKLPINEEGLKAANLATKKGICVNMTLCFSQEQAAAVYTATLGAEKPVFVSPFVGRLDDIGENGMDLVRNIIDMYKTGDGHVMVLAASIRNLDHLLLALKIACPLVTVPLKVIKEWSERGIGLPPDGFVYQPESLKPIPFKEVPLNKNWENYYIQHVLTDKGIEKFCEDWRSAFPS
jgi:transaldolase